MSGFLKDAPSHRPHPGPSTPAWWTPRERLTVAEQHQLRIARNTIAMPSVMVRAMGGMTLEEAYEIVRRLGGMES